MSAGNQGAGRGEAAAPGRDYSRSASLRLLLRLARPYRGLVIGALVTLLCDIVGTLLVPTELAALINSAIRATGTAELRVHGIAMLVAAIVGSGGCVISYGLVSRLSAYIGRDLRILVYEHSLVLSSYDFDRLGTGSMITRTLSDANVVETTVLMTFIMLAPVPVGCVVAVVLAFGIDVTMGRLLLVIVAVLALVMVVAVAKSTPIFLVLQRYIDRMNTRLREVITGVRVIRAFGKEADEQAVLDATFEDYAKNAIRVNLVFATADCLTFFFMNVVEVLILWLGADRVGAHAMQIGSISALVEYAMFITFFMMMGQFALLQLPRAMACLTRAAEVLSIGPTVADPEDPRPLAPVGADGRPDVTGPADEIVRFNHVCFRFADADEDTLQDLNLTLRRGEVSAIIGSTGSGKSTIARLLLRFHDVSHGSLTIRGRDVRAVSQEGLRSHIAYVPQKPWLFSGTIASNLRDGNPDATDEQIWHALDVAQAGFVRELPDGINSRVAQGGSNFSGGQRQRLAIARALVRTADLYIFDDSFSALDYKTDANLRHALVRELSGAAVLVIAQRVSTIHDADQILVLSDGCEVGLGTHDELLETCPTYRAIADSQTRGGGANV